MDNLFTKNKSVKLIIIILVFLTLFDFIYPRENVYAANVMEAVGGVLLEPLIKLICMLCEGLIYVSQMAVLGIPSNVYVPKDAGEAAKTFFKGWGDTIAAGFMKGQKSKSYRGAKTTLNVLLGVTTGWTNGILENNMLPDDFFFPIYYLSPQEIFEGDIPALDVNFISPKQVNVDINGDKKADYQKNKDSNGWTYKNTGITIYDSAEVLQPQIAKWYVAIRNMVIVGLMIVLLYIGIRIVISSAASEKAKYKENIKDWLIAVILVVFMHYIMAFSLTVTDYIIDMLDTQDKDIKFEMSEAVVDKIVDGASDKNTAKSQFKESDGKYYAYTNLMGYARLRQQLQEGAKQANTFNWDYIGYAIIYMVLVIYTLMFLVIYFKRVIYMAFLTMIAPLVALTYPLDKLSDGKAQAFDMWLKEYIYNLLIQPFHLLLYTMLIGSVMELAVHNMIYALVVLGFMIPAEKILRRFFGFEKAQGPGSLMGSVVGGSLTMDAVRKISGLGPPPPPKDKKGDKETTDDGKIHLSDRKADAGIATGDDAIVNAFGGNTGNGVRLGGNTSTGNKTGGSSKPGITALSGKYTPVSKTRATQMFNNAKVTPKLGKGNINAKKASMKTAKIPKISSSNINIGGIRTKPQLRKPKVDNKGKDRYKVLRNIGAGAGVAGHYAVKGLATAGKRIPGAVAKTAFGATMATVGVAAGLASGDLNNVAKYGAAGAIAGVNLGKNVNSGVMNAAETISKQAVPAVHDRYLKTRYSGDELKAHQNELADKRFMKDKKVQERLKEEYGSQWKEKRNEVLQFRKAGHVDLESTISAINMKGNISQAERIEYAKASAKIQKDPAKLDAYMKTLEENGITEDKRREVRRNLVNMNKI